MRECPICGNPVPPRRKTFCSDRCYRLKGRLERYKVHQRANQNRYFRDNANGYRDRHRNYMREYMRVYRANRRATA